MLEPHLFAYHAQHVRHAYRALLRATSYLPDSFARSYVYSYIRRRFQKRSMYADLLALPPNQRSRPLPRIKQALTKARQIEEAGNGNTRYLKKILLAAHGRVGPRKRRLIESLLQPDETTLPQNDTALEQLITEVSNPKPQSSLAKLPSKFTIFIMSQMQNQPPGYQSSVIKSKKPIIPRLNIWGRQTPLKLRESIRRKWYRKTLRRLFPPIPVHEFNRLRDLALGTVPLEEAPPRRKGPPPEPLTEEEKNTAVLQYIKFPRRINDPDLDDLRFDPAQEVITRKKVVEKSVRTSSWSRAMRRLYGSVWATTATMTQDASTGAWTVEWAGGRTAPERGDLTKVSPPDMELFEGLDNLPPPPPPPKKGRRRGGKKPPLIED